MAVKVGEGKWGPGGSADVTPDFAATGYRWANFGGGSQAIVGDALRLTWDVDPVGSGYYGPTLGFYVDDAGIFSNDFYVEFDAKFPGNVNGCKFVKFFGRRSVEQGYSNATFNLLWGTGEFANIIFTDGTDLEGDAGRAIFFSGGNNALNIGRAWGTAVVSTPQNRSFTDTDFGNTWHHFRFRYKQNTGTTSGNEVADGVFYVEIDGQVFLSVTNIFNRNPNNIPGIDNIQFGGWSQDGGGAFDLDIRNVVISTGGFMDALPDTTPDAFTIPAVTNAALNTPITSAAVTPTGYDTATALTVTGGTASIAGGAYSASPGNISPGQSFTARVQSSVSPATAASATVTIGGVSAAFNVTTLAADTTPDAFSFNTPPLASPGATVTSANTTITGINAAAAVSVTGGLVSINGGAFVSSGTIANGQTIAARVTASNSFSTPVTATVTIGGVSANFTATTIAADTTPDSFSFSPITEAELSSQQTSNTITIAGLNTAAPVSITGGAYSKNGGIYGQQPGSVVNGDTLSVRHTSSALNSTQITTTLTVGTFSANFISTTIYGETTMPESRVRDWTNTTINLLDTGVNFFAFDDGLDNVKPGVKVSPKSFLKSVLTANATSPSYLLNDGVCSIGTHVDGATITAPGIVGFPNKIGSSSSIPLGADAIHSWAVDSAYVPATAAADYAGIGIGYDNVNNQIAGVCNGFHCYIQYNVDGHSSVLSGSYQWIAGGRGVIAQGTNNKITAASLFGFIGNGRYQTVSGNWGTLVNGTDTIASGQGAFGGYARDALLSGEGSTALAARDVVVAGTFGLVQGQNTFIGGAYSVSFGNLNELGGVNSFAAGLSVRSTGDYSAVIGNDCGSAAAFSLTMGRHTENLQKASFAQSSRKITSQGDCQVYFANTAVRTTNNTPTNLEIAPGEHLVIPDQSCWTCSIVLTAANEATGDQASWEILADIKRFNGTASVVGTPTVTARATALTVGAAPSVGINAADGLVRVVATGAAATNIVWNASWRISQIKLPNSDTFTAATTDILTLATAAKRFLNGEKVRVSNSGGALPAGLSAGVDYYVVQGTNYYGNVSFKLATTATGVKLNKTTAVLAGQNVNTMATTSSVVDITNTGTGTHTITRF